MIADRARCSQHHDGETRITQSQVERRPRRQRGTGGLPQHHCGLSTLHRRPVAQPGCGPARRAVDRPRPRSRPVRWSRRQGPGPPPPGWARGCAGRPLRSGPPVRRHTTWVRPPVEGSADAPGSARRGTARLQLRRRQPVGDGRHAPVLLVIEAGTGRTVTAEPVPGCRVDAPAEYTLHHNPPCGSSTISGSASPSTSGGSGSSAPSVSRPARTGPGRPRVQARRPRPATRGEPRVGRRGPGPPAGPP